MLLGPRVLDGTNGFHLITPLVRTNGSTILVDRGFISEVAAAKRKYPTPVEVVEVHGMLRESQARNNFTPDNNPAKGEWYWADVTAMSAHAGGESSNVQPVLVEEIFGEFSCSTYVECSQLFSDGHAGDAAMRTSNGIPVGKVPVVDIRNAHASYVATW